MSEQLLSEMRPKPTHATNKGILYFIFSSLFHVYNNSTTIAFMSFILAATNDLAHLINDPDLQFTLDTADMTRLRPLLPSTIERDASGLLTTLQLLRLCRLVVRVRRTKAWSPKVP